MAFVEGQLLGPYRIVSRLGQGGMATVYKGYHERLNRTVAIKAVHQAFVQDPTSLARFEREAQIVARLEHPHIVPIYDYAEHEGQPYLVMKHIDGLTLKALLSQGRLSLDAVVGLMTAIAGALDYAHTQGVLHRDIKPSNILIGRDGTPYITDFGLARIAHAAESTLSENMLLGTPQYISPEQAKGTGDLTPQADIYSLAIVLYELVVGRVPFNADTPYATIHDHIYTPIPAPRALNPSVSPAVEAVLLKALAKEPADRYPTAIAMVDAFREATAGIDDASMHAPLPPIHEAQRGSLSPMPVRDAAPTAQSAAVEKPKRDGSVEFRLDFAQMGDQLRGMFENFEGWADNFGETPKDPIPIDEEQSIRRRIEEGYKKRGEFITHAVVYAVIMTLLFVIFVFTGDGGESATGFPFPWPLIVAFGWGSGLFAHAVDTWFQTGARAATQDRIVNDAMARQYGADWARTVSKKDYNRTRTKALKPYKKRVELLQHGAVYVAVNAMFWFIYASNMIGMISPNDMPSFPWPLIISLGWGAGLFAHAADTFFGGDARSAARERAVQREVERELMRREGAALEKPKRDFGIRLNEDGELTDSIAEAWQQDERDQRARR